MATRKRTPVNHRNILLVSPEFPLTYWGMQHAVAIIGKRATLPPLGLITVAACLPQSWDYRLVDLNVDVLTDETLAWADVVLVGGMHIQETSIHEVVARAKALNRPTVVGGPGPTTAQERYPDADVLVLGEVEPIIERLIEVLQDPQPGTVVEADGARPEMSEVPVPRYDLLRGDAYNTMSLQYSRGCPFKCEFCDIIEIFGRRPRVKSEQQILAELDAIYNALEYRGPVFFVDDNFIGNKQAAKRLMPAVAEWQRKRGFPFAFYTEASLNLAEETSLLEAMVAAGFTSVFLGIESPSSDALKSAGKTQNLIRDLSESVEIITASGLEVMGGFIVGFDQDDDGVFEAQRAFIQESPIAMAMVGLLMALPGTALARRLEAEGRLRTMATGDQFNRPNFDPAMNELDLLVGYGRLMKELYAPDAYYERCERYLALAPPPAVSRTITADQVKTLLRTMVHVGVRSPRRWRYWRLLARALRTSPGNFAQSVAHCVQGEHLMRYTTEVLLPRIDAAVAEVRAESAAAPVSSVRGARAGRPEAVSGERLVTLRLHAEDEVAL
jgi:radical SAM superfamily enzyme YgiQ (UPF0313 family)